MADQFDAFDDEEMAEFDDEEMAEFEDEFAQYDLDPLWVDGCPIDICVNSGWCHHRYKEDPR